MATRFTTLPENINYESPLIKMSHESLNDDLLFLFERLKIRVTLAAVFLDGHIPLVSKELFRELCQSLPINCEEHSLPHNYEKIRKLIKALNRRRGINGIIMDLPFALASLSNLIDPSKDVRLTDADFLKLRKLKITPAEEDILRVHMLFEKTFDAAIDQLSKRGYPI